MVGKVDEIALRVPFAQLHKNGKPAYAAVQYACRQVFLRIALYAPRKRLRTNCKTSADCRICQTLAFCCNAKTSKRSAANGVVNAKRYVSPLKNLYRCRKLCKTPRKQLLKTALCSIIFLALTKAQSISDGEKLRLRYVAFAKHTAWLG